MPFNQRGGWLEGDHSRNETGRPGDIPNGLRYSVAGVTGLEPATSGLTGQRSNQTELHPRMGASARADSERDSTDQTRTLSTPERDSAADASRQQSGTYNLETRRANADDRSQPNSRSRATLDQRLPRATAPARCARRVDAVRSRHASTSTTLYTHVLSPLLVDTGAAWQQRRHPGLGGALRHRDGAHDRRERSTSTSRARRPRSPRLGKIARCSHARPSE